MLFSLAAFSVAASVSISFILYWRSHSLVLRKLRKLMAETATAIHSNDLTGDVGRVLNQELNSSGDIIRTAAARQRNFLQYVLLL